MSTFKFQTNINCGNCVKAVRFFLEEETSIEHWEVDTDNPDKVLTVSGASVSSEKVIKIVEEAGFDIKAISA